jgi:hypothetical protein
MWFLDFPFEHVIFSSSLSLFLHCHYLDSYLFLFGHLDFPKTHLAKLHHLHIFQLFHCSHLSYFHLQKIIPLAVFTRLCPKIMQKTTILQQICKNYNQKKRKEKNPKTKSIYKKINLKV